MLPTATVGSQARAVALLSGPAGYPQADSIVAFGLAQRGTPYVYAGTSPLTGFDCSGFIMYTFAHFGVAVPHSTALLIDVGRPVPRPDAHPGDIVVFTGTAATSTTPGHAGIVISNQGEVPLRFVHASSARRESGVKVSQVEGTDYERRFMQVRRVVGLGAAVALPRPTPAKTARVALPVPALPSRRVLVEPAAAVATALPTKLPPHKMPVRHRWKSGVAAQKRPLASTKPVAKKPIKQKPAPKKAARKALVRKTVAKKKALRRAR